MHFTTHPVPPLAPSFGRMSESPSTPRSKRSRLNGHTPGPTISVPAASSAASDVTCILCLRPIRPSYEEKDTWKSYHQPMTMNEGAHRLLPAERYSGNGNRALIHACCWEVVWNVAGRPALSHAWVTNLIRHLFFMQYFATKTPWDCQTNDIDHELWAETPSHGRIDSSPRQEPNGLSILMLQKASYLLEKGPAIIHLKAVQEVDMFLGFCLMKGIPYQLAIDKQTDVRPHLKKIWQNLRCGGADRLPKTYNLWTAWQNATLAFEAFRRAPFPRPVASHSDLRMSYISRFSIPAERCHRLLFTFHARPCVGNTFNPCLQLVRFVYDGRMIGSPETGSLTSYIRVHSLSGIHIVRSRTGFITAIRVRDRQEWSEWLGTPQAGVSDSEHEWDSPKKDLIFNYNVHLSLIADIGIKSRYHA